MCWIPEPCRNVLLAYKHFYLVDFGPVAVRLHHKLPNSWAKLPRHWVAAVEEFILGDTAAGEFNCTKHMTGAKKLIDAILIKTGRINV